MKTAVEWFNEQIKLNAEFREIFKGRVSFTIGESKIEELLEQAKEMEKNNLYECGSFWRGKENKIENPFFEQWYNETFKSK
jgi:hypothetical protein